MKVNRKTDISTLQAIEEQRDEAAERFNQMIERSKPVEYEVEKVSKKGTKLLVNGEETEIPKGDYILTHPDTDEQTHVQAAEFTANFTKVK